MVAKEKINRDPMMVSKLCAMVSRGDLRDDHPQQRKPGQWNHDVRDNFIVTVLKNEDFDPIKICEQYIDGHVVLWLIDGLQRSTTIANFKAGKFALGRNIDPATIEYQEATKTANGIRYESKEFDLRGKSFEDLPTVLKEEFDNCPVQIVKHLDCSDEEIGRHIIRYNSGRAMVAAQKVTAYMYNCAKYVKKISGHAFFNDCVNFSEAKDRNGEIDKIVSETVMGLNFFEAWNKQAQRIGKHLNENATEQMFDSFASYLDRLMNVVTPQTGQLFTTKNALLWFMLFDRFTKYGLSDDKFQLFLENYDELKKIKVEVEHEYEVKKGSGEKTNVLSFSELDACKSTKDKGIILDKLHILESVMDEFLHINKEDFIKVVEETEVEEMDCARFVKANVEDVTDEDIELFEMVANDLSDSVDEDSWLLLEENRPCYLAIVGHAIREDKDEVLREWLPLFERNNTFNSNQHESFLQMRELFDTYLERLKVA